MPNGEISLVNLTALAIFGSCSQAANSLAPQTKFLSNREANEIPSLGAIHIISFIFSFVSLWEISLIRNPQLRILNFFWNFSFIEKNPALITFLLTSALPSVKWGCSIQYLPIGHLVSKYLDLYFSANQSK